MKCRRRRLCRERRHARYVAWENVFAWFVKDEADKAAGRALQVFVGQGEFLGAGGWQLLIALYGDAHVRRSNDCSVEGCERDGRQYGCGRPCCIRRLGGAGSGCGDAAEAR